MKLTSLCVFGGMACAWMAAGVAHAQCNNTTLTAGWSYTAAGTDNRGYIEHRAEAGLFTFNGTGQFTLKDTASHDGVINRLETSTGTYTVNADCTGTLIVHRDPYIVHFAITIDVVNKTFTLACTDPDAELWVAKNYKYQSTYTGRAIKQ
ncbi:MAG TPA: hypothetical protein VLY24_18975 [Bryobacteraceae bacterium]|nr:hypothetical protein [Bryobacteraceae bacterium]